MGRFQPISDELLHVMRRELRKYGVTLVKNKKTGATYVRHIAKHQTKPTTEAQAAARAEFTERTRKAQQWIDDNCPEACPPDGTPEYQSMMKSFKRQDKIKRLLNFVMSKL